MTEHEKKLVRTATYFGGIGWGKSDGRNSPDMLVAVHRGITFEENRDGVMWPVHAQCAEADAVVQDMAKWLKFRNINSYITALEREGAAIFLRARR